MALTADPLSAGREAIARHAWAEAFDLLQAADSKSGLEAEDLERLAEAGWWTARLDDCIAARERAFALRQEEGDRQRAAHIAMSLAKDYYAKGSSSIGSAWVNRAERLLEDEPDSIERGWLDRLRGVIALEGQGDYERALEHGKSAFEVARRFGNRELQALALHDQGRALVMRGDVDAGMAMIDEATAPATSGELSPFNTAVIYCNTITACKDLADYRRAGDWSEAAKRWCERQAIAGFPGMCRVYRASIMHFRGAWTEAEDEARRACEELGDFNVSYAAEAFYALGEIRLRAGDLEAAEEAFKHSHELGRDPQPGLAFLRLVQGRIEGARSCIVQALANEAGELHRSRLLPAQVEIALETGDRETARAAVEELTAIADRYGSEVLQASAHFARGQLALAEDEREEAVRAARQALRMWHGVDAPYEAARTRVILADAYFATGNVEDAGLELRAAVAAFERLGAVQDARAAREKLGRTGAASATSPERRATRTFMFTDIVRSTNLVEAIGDDAWAELVAWHDRMLRSLFSAHEGEEVDHAGDGFFVAFPDTESGVECAVAIQRSLAEHRRQHGFAPQVRVGLHAASSTRQGAGYKGRGVHAAARIGALAGGGEILVSKDSLEAASRFPVSEPRSESLKGFEDPVELVSIDWP